MAYSEKLADRIKERFADLDNLEENELMCRIDPALETTA